jgi:hypothetical protein
MPIERALTASRRRTVTGGPPADLLYSGRGRSANAVAGVLVDMAERGVLA